MRPGHRPNADIPRLVMDEYNLRILSATSFSARTARAVAYELDAEQSAAVTRYTRTLEDKIVQLIEEACEGMQPASLSYGEGTATFAVNRRKIRGEGYVIAPNPEGPVDHIVPVLLVSDENGRALAVLFGYACHNTTLGGDFYQYNGDYAGFAQLEFEAQHPGVTPLFMIGCGADANPEPRGKLELAEQHGKALAAAVDRVLAEKLAPVRGPLSVAFERVDLPFVDPPTKEELEQRRGQGNVYQQRLTELLLERIAKQGKIDAAYPCPVQVVRFGDDLTLVALAGEVVVDYAIRLRKEFAGERLWVAGYSNEVFAYVPSERVLSEGGYEGGGAMVYFGWHGPFQPGVHNEAMGRFNGTRADGIPPFTMRSIGNLFQSRGEVGQRLLDGLFGFGTDGFHPLQAPDDGGAFVTEQPGHSRFQPLGGAQCIGPILRFSDRMQIAATVVEVQNLPSRGEQLFDPLPDPGRPVGHDAQAHTLLGN